MMNGMFHTQHTKATWKPQTVCNKNNSRKEDSLTQKEKVNEYVQYKRMETQVG